VLALVDGGFTLKRFRRRGGRIWLQAENPSVLDAEVCKGMSFEIRGVVTKSIRALCVDNTFALVDCNNVYAPCERVFQPELAGNRMRIVAWISVTRTIVVANS
jgi:hypothetical protein